MAAFIRQDWFDRFTTELGLVIGALTEAKVATVASVEAPDSGWIVSIEATAGASGTFQVQFDRTGAETVSQQIMGLNSIPPASAVIDTLKEICAQAIGGAVQHLPTSSDVTLSVGQIVTAPDTQAPGAALVGIAFGSTTLRMAFWGEIEFVAPRAKRAEPSGGSPKLDAILDIDLPLMVRFGRTEMTLKSLIALGPGSVIDLGRSPDDTVEVLVSNQIIARGEVVVVGGNYGVRITDVVSPAERVKTMEVELR